MIDLFVIVSALFIQSPSQDEPTIFINQDKWLVIKDGLKCTAAASYKNGLNLYLSYNHSDRIYEMRLAYEKWQSLGDSQIFEGRLSFDSEIKSFDVGVGAYKSSAGPELLLAPTDTIIQNIAARTQMTLHVEGRQVVNLNLAGSKDAISSLHECAVKSLAEYDGDLLEGIDGEPIDQSRPAQIKYVPRDKNLYPRQAFNKKHDVKTVMRLAISDKGRVVLCEVAKRSFVKSLDEEACTLAKNHVRFVPSLDFSGDPQISISTITVDWQEGRWSVGQ